MHGGALAAGEWTGHRRRVHDVGVARHAEWPDRPETREEVHTDGCVHRSYREPIAGHTTRCETNDVERLVIECRQPRGQATNVGRDATGLRPVELLDGDRNRSLHDDQPRTTS